MLRSSKSGVLAEIRSNLDRSRDIGKKTSFEHGFLWRHPQGEKNPVLSAIKSCPE